jgi:hypothetical protein
MCEPSTEVSTEEMVRAAIRVSADGMSVSRKTGEYRSELASRVTSECRGTCASRPKREYRKKSASQKTGECQSRRASRR